MQIQEFQSLLSPQESQNLSKIIFHFLDSLVSKNSHFYQQNQIIEPQKIESLLENIQNHSVFDKAMDSHHLKESLLKLHKFYLQYQSFDSIQPFVFYNLYSFIEKEVSEYYTYLFTKNENNNSYNMKAFFSPLGFFNIFKKENLFSFYQHSDTISFLLSLENKTIEKVTHPILQEGIEILQKSIENPLFFQTFIPYWKKFRSILLPQNFTTNHQSILEKDFLFISSLYENQQISKQLFQQYSEYHQSSPKSHDFYKSILAKKMTEFFFTHFENFQQYSSKIPNGTVWIFHSRLFLSTQQFIQNIQQKHIDYFSLQNKNIHFYEEFISSTIFSQSFSSDIAIMNIRDLFQKNLHLENLFSQKNQIEKLQSLDLYIRLLSVHMKNNQQELISLYQKTTLENQLNRPKSLTQSIKI
jgi:hypothetical protein